MWIWIKDTVKSQTQKAKLNLQHQEQVTGHLPDVKECVSLLPNAISHLRTWAWRHATQTGIVQIRKKAPFIFLKERGKSVCRLVCSVSSGLSGSSNLENKEECNTKI